LAPSKVRAHEELGDTRREKNVKRRVGFSSKGGQTSRRQGDAILPTTVRKREEERPRERGIERSRDREREGSKGAEAARERDRKGQRPQERGIERRSDREREEERENTICMKRKVGWAMKKMRNTKMDTKKKKMSREAHKIAPAPRFQRIA
jgi:hypothetical protein